MMNEVCVEGSGERELGRVGGNWFLRGGSRGAERGWAGELGEEEGMEYWGSGSLLIRFGS